MRVALLTILLHVAFVPEAFTDSLEPSSELCQADWSGFYSGVIFGTQFGRSSDATGAFGYNADNDVWDYTESGLNVGANFGYSFKWRWLVFGPEIELGHLGMKGSGAQPSSPGLDTIGQSGSGFYTGFRARVGVDVNPFLIFATGGAIGAIYTTQVVDSCNIAPCGGTTIDANRTDFAWGYSVGGGAEYSFRKRWSVKLEYLYFNLSQSLSGTTNLGTTYAWTGKTSGNVIRAGLSYYF